MLIIKNEKNNSNLTNRIINIYKRLIKKDKISFLFTLFVLFILINIPLDFGLSSKKVTLQKKLAIMVQMALGTINKELGYMSKELILYGGNITSITNNYINSIPQKSDIIDININLDDFNQLKSIRNEALGNRILTRTDNDEFKAKLLYKGTTYPIEIRLKGDTTDHLLGEKWSFRVKMKKKKLLFGMKEFSLQHPRTRTYLNEYVYHKFVEREKQPYLRYEFITLRINGKNLGSYAIEEHFSKLLIENSGYREGPILKISENNLWKESKRAYKLDGQILNSSLISSKNSEINLFNSKKVLSNKSMLDQFNLGHNLLNDFISGKTSTSLAFDRESTALFFAINDLFASTHGYAWHNMRFYFNPILSRLTPIGFDAQPPIRVTDRSLSIDSNPLGFFDDQEFVKEYLYHLNRITNNDYINDFLEDIKYDLNKSKRIINKSYPYVKFIEKELIKNSKNIENRLKPIQPLILKKESNLSNNQIIKFRIANTTILPIKIIKIKNKDKIFIPQQEELIIPGRKSFSMKKYNNYIFKSKNIKNESLGSEYIIEYKILGSHFPQISKLEPKIFSSIIYKNDNSIKRIPNTNTFDFLETDHKNKKVTFKSGKFVLDRPLITPKGYSLVANNPLELEISEKGAIISQGEVNFIGAPNAKIKFKGIVKGGGVLVLNSEKQSRIEHAIFSNLSSPGSSINNITGAINFYNSPVIIKNSNFEEIEAEDALNLFRSDFQIIGSKFKATKSDALDIDFSNGIVEESEFINIGNDGIDISGSSIRANNIKINNSPDKAISVGEKSKMTGESIEIEKAGIGIASKDLSMVKLENVKLKDVSLCLTSFQKKAEYGAASITIKIKDDKLECKNLYLLEPKSSIFLNKKNLKPNVGNVNKLLYGNIYGKATERN